MTHKSPFSADVDPVAAEVLLDVLLLSIIKANPAARNDATSDQKRLNSAKRSLFGIYASRGRALGSDLPELVHMARKYLALRGPAELNEQWVPTWPDQAKDDDPGSYPLAVSALNQKHVGDDGFIQSPQFPERAHTLQKKFDSLKVPILKMVYGRDNLAASVFIEHLRELKGLLALLGVSVIDPLDPIRDAKYPI